MQYVVPECFRGFAATPGVVTIGDLLAKLDAAPEKCNGDILLVYPGLGQSVRDELQARFASLGLRGSVFLDGCGGSRVPPRLVHKQDECNVCVSAPVFLADGSSISGLVVDGGNAEMADHVTGQHVPGMVLIEAARQAMMSTVEMSLFQPDLRGVTGYVLRRLDIRFESYAFPVDLEIHTRVDQCEREASGVLKLALTVRFLQHSLEVCQVTCDAVGYPHTLLDRLETRAARGTLKKTLQAWSTREQQDQTVQQTG